MLSEVEASAFYQDRLTSLNSLRSVPRQIRNDILYRNHVK